MVRGICVAGSPILDSHTSPYVCLVARASSPNLRRKQVGKKLSSSFMDSRFPAKAVASKKQKRVKGFVIVNSLGGQYEDETFSDVKSQIFNLFTLTAATTVLNQLYETNPTQYRWLNDFVRINKPTNRKRFLLILQKENHELAERVMETRLHLFAKWVKNLDHDQMYKDLSDQNLELMRERLMETVKWPSDDTNT
ncbi:hypothetical protein SSX86_023415 [Deinandra increscens subsp. villosa]|uniref:Chaperonin-like RbcX protein n=1 Tax=Deinandra increscens subsp. villosa TaxID=3103831 RepID=A0AAP0GPV9_9ASTR